MSKDQGSEKSQVREGPAGFTADWGFAVGISLVIGPWSLAIGHRPIPSHKVHATP